MASSLALVLFGLFLGILFGVSLARRRAAAAQPEKAAAENRAENVAGSGPASSAEPVTSLAVIEGDLIASRELCARQAEEIARLSEGFAGLREQMGERDKRLGELAQLWDRASGSGGTASASLPLLHLEEVLRSETERQSAGLAHLERLEARLVEEAEKLEAGSRSMAGLRSDFERRLAGSADEAPSMRRAAERFAQVDDQLRVLHQNVAGCVSRAATAREHLRAEHTRLREAADILAGQGNVSGPLQRLRRVKAKIEELKNGTDQEIGEMIGRIDWAVRESPAGFLKAIDRLNEGDLEGDPGVTLLQADVWQRLGEVRGSLAGLSLMLESGTMVAIPGTCARRRLLETVSRAIESTEMPPAEAEKDRSAPMPCLSPEETALKEQLQTLRFSIAARDGEIARLRSKLGEREAELAALNSPKSEPVTALVPEVNPVAARLLPGPVRRSLTEKSDPASGPRSSRQFIRRLLGLGAAGISGGVLAATARESRRGLSGAEKNAIAVPAASLAEARAALAELRHLPAGELPSGGGNGKYHAKAESDEEEMRALRLALSDRDGRIATLERELARLRESTPPTPYPKVDIPLSPLAGLSLDAMEADLLVPEEIGAEPTATDSPTRQGVIVPGELVPVTDREMILFRGSDPAIWNTEVGDSDTPGAAFARPVERAPEDMGFLRIRRLDTGDSMVAAITRADLVAGGCAKARRGWSGRGEQYFGACHLGLFDESLPREVETKFGAGGWGFGHRESVGSGQAFAWAGRLIDHPGDGFEISVGPLPEGVTLASGPDSTPRLPTISPLPVVPPVTAATVAAALAASVRENPPPPARPAAEETPAAPSTAARESLARQADNRTGGLVLFRSNDPAIWGTEVFAGSNRRSRALDHLPDGLAYLRLRRVDTGEGVVCPITNNALTDDGDGLPRGFNGTNELYYGAHHLGLFDESLPQDVETRFTYGGWGFGHSVLGPERQACGWEGRPVATDTVFEIAVFRRMPVLGDRDRILEA